MEATGRAGQRDSHVMVFRSLVVHISKEKPPSVSFGSTVVETKSVSVCADGT
jgi:hypothetical protein